MFQDVMICVMNSTDVFGDSVNLEMQSSESYDKCYDLDAELLKKQNSLNNNRDTHEDYLKKTIENTNTIRGLVEHNRKQNPSEPLLDSACMFTKHVQELLVYVSQTCPSLIKPSERLVVVTPLNKVKKVRSFKPFTSSSNIHKQVESSKTPDSNTHVLHSIGLKSYTSASRSQPTGNTKNDRISQMPSSNMKNKVEVQLRRANLSSNKKNHVKDPICDANDKHTMLNANSELIYVKCKQCMFDTNHDVCFLDFVNDVNVRSKSKSAKQSKQYNIWKPTGKVFTKIGYNWKPTGKLFTLVGNSCPLTRITSTKVVPLKGTTPHSIETQKPELKVYSKKPKQVKSVGLCKKSKIIESRIAINSEPNHLWESNATDVPSSSSLVNDRLSRLFFAEKCYYLKVYYVEGLKHNVGKYKSEGQSTAKLKVKVVKALYGLHQAPRAWYATLSTFLEKHGYKRGTIDKTLFIKRDKKDIMLVQVYVDDIIFGYTKKSWCDEFEALMKSRYVAEDTQVTPKTSHLNDVKRIFKYLKGKPHLGLWYVVKFLNKTYLMAMQETDQKNSMDLQMYALTTNPTIYDSLVKQFWQTATANTLADGTLELQATIDTIVYTITEASIRNKLQLADASGITMLPNNEIFKGMGHMG
ncbi:retrovirus-related pol polyprotein from transposon TNT 1-94, partial [Tanacetum coccineum]